MPMQDPFDDLARQDSKGDREKDIQNIVKDIQYNNNLRLVSLRSNKRLVMLRHYLK